MAMKLLFVALLAAAICAEAIPFSNCGKDTDRAHIDSIDITPWPMKKGSDFTVVVTGTVNERITGGKVTIKVKMWGITVLTKNLDICDGMGVSCPVGPGPIVVNVSAVFFCAAVHHALLCLLFRLSFASNLPMYFISQTTQNIPSSAPSGSYDIDIVSTDQDGNQLFCVSIKASFTAKSNGVSIPVKYHDCSTTQEYAVIEGIDISPWPIVKGQEIDVQLTGTLKEQVTGGKSTVTISILGFQVLTKTVDLCTFDESIKCPMQPGPVHLSKKETFPASAPSGKYTVEIKAQDQNTKELFCFSFDATL